MQGSALSKCRTTLFEFLTRELIELSQFQPELMHVLLAWLADKSSTSVESMIESFHSAGITPEVCESVIADTTVKVPCVQEGPQRDDGSKESRRELRTRRGYRAQST